MIAFAIMCCRQQGDRSLAAPVKTLLDRGRIGCKFGLVPLAKFRPATRAAMEPFPQRGAGRHVLRPIVGAQTLLRYSPRPEPVHQQARSDHRVQGVVDPCNDERKLSHSDLLSPYSSTRRLLRHCTDQTWTAGMLTDGRTISSWAAISTISLLPASTVRLRRPNTEETERDSASGTDRVVSQWT